MRICLEDKCVLALLQSNPTFRRRFTAIWRMAVTDGIVSAFIPPIRALSQTKKAQTYQGWLFRRNIRISKLYDGWDGWHWPESVGIGKLIFVAQSGLQITAPKFLILRFWKEINVLKQMKKRRKYFQNSTRFCLPISNLAL